MKNDAVQVSFVAEPIGLAAKLWLVYKLSVFVLFLPVARGFLFLFTAINC